LHPKALNKIAELSAARIVYVACKPKSLVRDLPMLLDAGYAIGRIEAVDMFPRTPHVEAVVLLRRHDRDDEFVGDFFTN
jgi:tRNA/tmRNA/rRNA uracil-C5-methylase (TrmA/RlmC/RlmD family)